MVRRAACLAVGVAFAFPLLECAGGDANGDDLDIGVPKRLDGAEAGVEDGPNTTTDAKPAPPACNPQKPFGAPVLLAGFDPSKPFATPRLSADELTIYFTTNVATPDGGGATNSELCRATRASKNADFASPTVMNALSSLSNDNDPSVAADNLSLWFHSGRSGNAEIWAVTRGTPAEEWGEPMLVPNVNTPAPEAHAYYRSGAGELWFVRQSATDYDIFVAKKNAIGFATPTEVKELNTVGSQEWQPHPSEDGLSVLFASDRPGGLGGFDLWIAKRASTNVPFGAPVPLTELNSTAADFAGWISTDGCRIYFSSTRGTPNEATHRLWFAARPL
jgi:hypothetical protein